MKLFSLLKLFVFLGVLVTVFCLHIRNNTSDQNDSIYNNSNTTILNRKRRIIGGEKTSIFDHPWQVSLRHYYSHICGGSIISDQWVITAAHCFKHDLDPESYTIRVGSSRQSSGGRIIGIDNIIRHYGYDNTTRDYDFALLKLSEQLSFDNTVKAIGLPSLYQDISRGQNCVVSGWGSYHEKLHEVRVQVHYQFYCHLFGWLTDRMFCADSNKNGIGVCFGDSGGALSCSVGSESLLIGIVSHSHANGVCGDPWRPNIYAKVSSVRYWIELHTEV